MKPPLLRPASADERAWIAEQAERRLSPEEFQSYVEAPVSEWERENAEALITWFTTRYKTPLERLAYARRAQARQGGRAWKSDFPARKDQDGRMAT